MITSFLKIDPKIMVSIMIWFFFGWINFLISGIIAKPIVNFFKNRFNIKKEIDLDYAAAIFFLILNTINSSIFVSYILWNM